MDDNWVVEYSESEGMEGKYPYHVGENVGCEVHTANSNFGV